MGARRFGPDVSRFLSPDFYGGALSDLGLSMDPITGGNRYSLGGGNPISFVEVDGHKQIEGGGTGYNPDTQQAHRDEGKEPCYVGCGSVNWSVAGSAIRENAHGITDAGGWIPGIGDAVDILHGAFYAVQGEFGKAAPYGIAMIPFLGNPLKEIAKRADDLVSGIRRLTRGVDEAPAMARGFGNAEDCSTFSNKLKVGLAEAGHADVVSVLQGSAVTGRSFRTGAAFDVGRRSDFDVALASRSLLSKAQGLGISTRSGGLRTGPLSRNALDSLGLSGLRDELATEWNRPVNFMIFESVEAALNKGPGVVIP